MKLVKIHSDIDKMEDKTQQQSTMLGSYCIQRGKFEQRDHKEGIDSMIALDYMGSSEFEWGAIPQSLKTIRDQIDLYEVFEIKIKKKPIILFCKKDQFERIVPRLRDLAAGKTHTKEYTAFDSYIKGDGFWKDKVDHWWEIDNHFMWWKDNKEFTEKFIDKIKNPPKKKEEKPSLGGRLMDLITLKKK